MFNKKARLWRVFEKERLAFRSGLSVGQESDQEVHYHEQGRQGDGDRCLAVQGHVQDHQAVGPGPDHPGQGCLPIRYPPDFFGDWIEGNDVYPDDDPAGRRGVVQADPDGDDRRPQAEGDPFQRVRPANQPLAEGIADGEQAGERADDEVQGRDPVAGDFPEPEYLDDGEAGPDGPADGIQFRFPFPNP